MKKYTIGLITGALLAVSAMMFMGAQNKNLGDIIVDSIYITGELGTTMITGGLMGIKNKYGNIVHMVSVDDGGAGIIKTYNADGKLASHFGTSKSNGSITTFNEHGVMTGYFGTGKDKNGMAALFDRYGDVGWSASGKQ